MPRVLIADDEDPMRSLVARAIAMDGHETVTAEDGAEALDILTRERGAFDLLLTDIQMPVMDGIALALAAARDFPDLKILLMTGFADQRERASGLNAIVHDVVTKPFAVADIRTAVADALAARKAGKPSITARRPREGGVPSTPRLLNSIADVSGILGHPPSAGDDSRSASASRSIILQQPLDVIEFDLRAGRVGETAAQFFQDPAHPLHVDLAGDFHRIVVVELVVTHRPASGSLLLAAPCWRPLGLPGPSPG